MIKSIQFNTSYFVAFILVFVIEASIAIYLKEGFIRHTFGDYLAVFLLYFFFKSFIKGKTFQIALVVFIISFIVEFLQLTNFLELIHLQNNNIAKVVLGSTFQISDLIAYTLGVITILIFEKQIPWKHLKY